MQNSIDDIRRNYGYMHRINVATHTKVPHISGCINFTNYAITIGINHNYYKDVMNDPQTIAYIQKHDIRDPLKKMVDDATRHEICHWSFEGGYFSEARRIATGCPINGENYEYYFYEHIHKTLKDYGKEDHAREFSNIVTDFINNTHCLTESNMKGIVLFYDDNGRNAKNKKFGKSFEAFVKLQMLVYGDVSDRKLLSRYFDGNSELVNVSEDESTITVPKVAEPIVFSPRYTDSVLVSEKGDNNEIVVSPNENDTKPVMTPAKHCDHYKIESDVNDAVGKIMKRLGLKVYNEWDAENDAYEENRSILMNPYNWKKISTVMSEEFANLLEDGEEFPMFGAGGNFEKDVSEPEKRRKAVQRRIEKGEEMPSYMGETEVKDTFYQIKAKEIAVFADSDNDGLKFPIIPIGHRPFDNDLDEIEDIDVSRLILGENGGLNFEKPTSYWPITIPVEKTRGGLPKKALVLIDTSGSMKHSPGYGSVGDTSIIPWGDQSKYHFAVLGVHGVMNYLDSVGYLDKMEFILCNFSTQTKIAKGLYESRILALQPQWGWTFIEMDKVQDALGGEKALVFSASDGEIYSDNKGWSDIEADFLEMARTNDFFHLQIDGTSEMSKALEADGQVVRYINGDNDFAMSAIDLTKKSLAGYDNNL